MAFRQLPLRLQLRSDEADGHDPVLHGGPQQPGPRPIPRALVLERHLAEPREGIPHMRRVVDRQTTSAARIDVCKGTVGKLRTLLRAERWHARMIARTPAVPSTEVLREMTADDTRTLTSPTRRPPAAKARRQRPWLSTDLTWHTATGALIAPSAGPLSLDA